MTWRLSLERTDRGRRIVLGRQVNAPAAVAWHVLTAVEHWPTWGPPVTGVEYPYRTIRAGTVGRIRAFGLLSVPFRIHRVADRHWTWTAWGLTPPADGHGVEALGDVECEVTLELPLWAPWYLPVCALALRNVAAVAERAPSGESVPPAETTE